MNTPGCTLSALHRAVTSLIADAVLGTTVVLPRHKARMDSRYAKLPFSAHGDNSSKTLTNALSDSIS